MRHSCAVLLAGILSTTAAARAAVPASTPDAFASSANAFALELYPQVAGENAGGNLFFSPYSIDTALLMAAAGAKGNTAAEFASTLHTGSGAETATAAAALMKQLSPPGDLSKRPFSLTVANALWVDQHFPILPTYTASLQKTFGVTDAFPLDFAGKPEEGRKTINTWIEDHTNKKITDLIPAGALTGDTRVVLTNAIYFKASWQTPFEASATQKQSFHAAGGKEVSVPLMRLQHTFGYHETAEMQVASLPYKTSDRGASDLEMVIVLPRKADGLAAVEKQLTPKNVEAWTGALEPHLLNVQLPRFKTTSTLPLNKPLAAIGLRDAFTEKADFSGISSGRSPDQKLRISDVLHKAYVAVDEQGTEAAAATAIMMRTLAMPVGGPTEFRADHPFLFLIEHRPSHMILFVGRVNDPSKE
jgi:serpin B